MIQRVPGRYDVRDIICKENNSILITNHNEIIFRRPPNLLAFDNLYETVINLKGVDTTFLARMVLNVVYDGDKLFVYFSSTGDSLRKHFIYLYQVVNTKIFSDLVIKMYD